MPLDFEKLSPQELLAAESAVLTMRGLLAAVKTGVRDSFRGLALTRWCTTCSGPAAAGTEVTWQR